MLPPPRQPHPQWRYPLEICFRAFTDHRRYDQGKPLPAHIRHPWNPLSPLHFRPTPPNPLYRRTSNTPVRNREEEFIE